jgi:hypothetical protein
MSDAKNVDCSQFAFAYRLNGDGSIDSICLTCYLTAATAENEAEVHEREKVHHCSGRSSEQERNTNARKVVKPGARKKSAATRANVAEAQKTRWAKAGM